MANRVILVPPSIIANSPSRQSGINYETEVQFRIYGCQLIQKAGVLLKLQVVTVASGQTILHRFYFRRSLVEFDVNKVAAASLYLACKLEEEPRRIRDIVNIFNFLLQSENETNTQTNLPFESKDLSKYVLLHNSDEFNTLRAKILRCERYILLETGFMISQTLVHPHRYILQYIHTLFKKSSNIDIRLLSQIAWGYLNDSLRTTLCCEVQPAVVAVGSIYLAACDIQISLPMDSGWFLLFDVSWDDVVKVCKALKSLYMRPIPSYRELRKKIDRGKVDITLELNNATIEKNPESSDSNRVNVDEKVQLTNLDSSSNSANLRQIGDIG